jgi:hypothetical protein
LHDDISRAEDQLGLVVFPIGWLIEGIIHDESVILCIYIYNQAYM